MLGYSLEEVKGRHHRMFVDPAEANSPAYAEFWASLGRGQFQSAEYRRIGKGGKEIYIQASYNPIFHLNGKPFKVVKFAKDVTEQVSMRKGMAELLTAIGETSIAVAASAEEMTAVSQQLTTNAGDTAQQANAASATSEEVSANVNVVAASSEEMMASIREISKSATEAARVAKAAVRHRRKDHPNDPSAWRLELRDREGHQGHYLDRAADQPAGAQRHHRGGPRRRGGQGISQWLPTR